jgi:hypothetical protein
MVSPPTNDINGDKSADSTITLPADDPMPLPTTSIIQQRTIPQPIKTSSRALPSNWLGEKAYILSTAALIGLATGTNIAIFKKAVECVREILYGDGLQIPSWIYDVFGSTEAIDGEHFLRLSEIIPVALAPAVGGLLVGVLLKVGGDLPPGLRDSVTEG